MKMLTFALLAAASLVVLGGAVVGLSGAEAPRARTKAEADALMQQGDVKDAYEAYRVLTQAADADPAEVEDSLKRGLICLGRLGRPDESDEFLESALAARKGDARTAVAAASLYLDAVPHQGFVVAGEFSRGRQRRQDGRYVDATERDRVRALQLLTGSIGAMKADPDRARAGRFFQALAHALAYGRYPGAAWRFQSLTALDALPDYDESFGMMRMGGPWGGPQAGAPVDAEGSPVYYRVPESFEKAANDGERWRWALAQSVEADAELLNTVRMTLGDFALGQFGPQTLGYGVQPFWGEDDGQPDGPTTSIYALETLKDDETVARLASGVKRFTLPDEFNPIRIYLSILDDPKTGKAQDATNALAGLFQDRRQFVRAAEYWKLAKSKYGDPNGVYQAAIDQIEAPWGRFEPATTHAAGRGATFDFTYRNGRKVRFEAHRLLVDKLLEDVKAYIKSRPEQVDWQRIDVNEIGARIVAQDQRQYQGESVARWELDLDPPADHFDRRIAVTTPLQKAGAYLVTAQMEGGNVGRIVAWIDDTVLVRKPMGGSSFYYAADALTGAPVAGASLDLFGWRMRQIDGGRRFQVEVQEKAHRSDANGQVVASLAPADPEGGMYQWLATARTAEGRLAYLGFNPIWPLDRTEEVYDQVRVFTVTDRPVYRPGGPVKFKFWIARSRYDRPGASEFAERDFQVEVNDPKGEKVFTKSVRADAFGGLAGEYELPSDAALGMYYLNVVDHGGGSFRVEEYKKPEFEVKVEAPGEPVALGEKVKATIRAGYYFGGPVTQGTVKYKITRRYADDRWFPVMRWDWLYGAGYWWFAGDYAWYPGWNAWGTRAPQPWWWIRPEGPPEVVADAEVPIGPDGKVEVEIDTALARAAHPGRDHKYEVEAQVTDASRRTIVGNGDVLVARKPFSVYTWLDRGHYRAGDTIQAEIRAQTLDRKPVVGEGTLKLLRVTYEADGKPVETPLESWPLKLDADGRGSQAIKAAQPGQYRISATIDDGRGHSIEGGYLLTVAGQGFNGASFRFDDLEIIPDKKDYKPGEKVRLLINTNRANSTVLLFVRPTNGVYPAPSTFQMRGKTETVEIDVATADMPNLFLEAMTISDGKVHDQAREIAVPPESRIVDVAVEPSQATYKPGEKAKLALKLTGPDGKPFVGSTVLTVYDKAVEYISGGSNAEPIKDVFWKWKRSHNPLSDASVSRRFFNLLTEKETPMADLGVFGGGMGMGLGGGRFQRMGGGMGGMGGMMGEAAPAMAPMAMAAPAPLRAMRGPTGGAEARAEGLEMAKVADQAVMDFDAGGAPAGPAPAVRTNFADTAFWSAAVETKPDGTAELEFPLPDSLTTWKTRAWTMGLGTRVGQAEAEFTTSKDLLVRLQAPRFFVQKDEVVLSAVVHSKLKEAKSVQVVLELDGSVLEPLAETSKTIELAAGGEARVDWTVKVAHEGQAVVRMKALADSDSDAAQMTFPAFVHGMLKMEAVAGAMRPDEAEAKVTIKVPAERRPEQTRLEVRYSPTLAGALVDALPYLVDYPYGCTEQTLNRFLPTVITQRTLIDMGVDLKAIQAAHTNLNAQELGPNRPRFQSPVRPKKNPVFDMDEVVKMSRAGLDRLAEMQLSDGGWGWFSGFGERSFAHTTAQVVHGLQIARGNDLALPEGMLERGVAWLTNYQAEQVNLLRNGLTETKPYKKSADDLDALVFLVLADADVRTPGMIDFLERDRPGLSVYGKCLYGLALHKFGEADKLAKVLQNISQFVVEDEENQTAWLKLPNQGSWWYWYGSETETDAFYLKLLARTDPKGRLASRLVKYILNNREHGAYWKSTRDTAYNVEALAEYLKASGEDRPNLSVAIAVDGRVRKEVTITPANLFSFDASLVLEGAELDSGEHAITFTKKGSGPLYFNTYLTNFTLEDPIARAGLEVKVNRQAYRLIRDDKQVDVAGGRGQAVSQRVEKYRREPLADGATLKSGDLVEVELEIDSKNDYEYLVFEDFKAAGFEPVEVRSGYNGNDMGAYVEFRDERVAFLVPRLSRGKHSVAYRLRAEIPGKFHALPARGEAMYAPELKGNSDEIRLEVTD